MPRSTVLASLVAALLLSSTLQACAPVDTCDADQYYLQGACAPCPDDATRKGEDCQCDDPDKVFDRVAAECRLAADAAVEMGEGGDCQGYCGFISSCLGDNDFVLSAGADAVEAAGVVDGDDSSCRSACEMATPDAADERVLGCIEAGAQSASCAGRDDFEGADEALTIIDGCCLREPQSGVCQRFCSALAVNPVTATLLDACQ